MSACADQELLLGGLVDNELDAANIAMVEGHVARCEGCRGRRRAGVGGGACHSRVVSAPARRSFSGIAAPGVPP